MQSEGDCPAPDLLPGLSGGLWQLLVHVHWQCAPCLCVFVNGRAVAVHNSSALVVALIACQGLCARSARHRILLLLLLRTCTVPLYQYV